MRLTYQSRAFTNNHVTGQSKCKGTLSNYADLNHNINNQLRYNSVDYTYIKTVK